MPGIFAGLSNTEIKNMLTHETPSPRKKLLILELVVAVVVVAAFLFGTPGSIGF